LDVVARIWGTSGKHLGSTWGASGRHGKHLGSIWETSGTPRSPGASEALELSGSHLGQLGAEESSGRNFDVVASIWEASGRHLGNIWEGKHMGSIQASGIWEASGKHLWTSEIWEASGKHLGSIWEASGRHLESIWGASGEHLGLQEAMELQEIPNQKK